MKIIKIIEFQLRIMNENNENEEIPKDNNENHKKSYN